MTLTIIALTPKEEFLQMVDPDLCEIKEINQSNGLRAIQFEYRFQDFTEDKQLFKHGNKLWIQGDINVDDCLYVINTKVEQDLFKENSFTFEAEEVLVELNNAPVVSHLDLTNHSSVFKTRTVNGTTEVKIDWNSLNWWFGEFFNMGIIQNCLNSDLQYIPFFGTYNLMSLLRYIEEQTGNTFVTRYEKSKTSNVIHRYLDFLNPINMSKNWELHLEYDFLDEMTSTFYDADWNEIPEENPWLLKRYINSQIQPESITETVEAYDPETDAEFDAPDTLDTTYEYIPEDENVEDEALIKHYKTYSNFNPEHIQFQIVNNEGQALNADGTVYQTGDDNPLIWTGTALGLSDDNPHILITLARMTNVIGIDRKSVV